MSKRVSAWARVVLLATLPLAAGIGLRAAQQAGTPPLAAPTTIASGPAQKLDLKSIPNFARVAEALYRGGQPRLEGYAELKKLGVTIVVNLRDERGEIETERRAVEGAGLCYVNIPWSSRRNPTSRQVVEFLELFHANPNQTIFVHCHYGKDRTGVMVAAYRIARENWTATQAIAEMNAFHYHHFWYPHLRTYVRNLPQALVADPVLRQLVPAARASTP